MTRPRRLSLHHRRPEADDNNNIQQQHADLADDNNTLLSVLIDDLSIRRSSPHNRAQVNPNAFLPLVLLCYFFCFFLFFHL